MLTKPLQVAKMNFLRLTDDQIKAIKEWRLCRAFWVVKSKTEQFVSIQREISSRKCHIADIETRGQGDEPRSAENL